MIRLGKAFATIGVGIALFAFVVMGAIAFTISGSSPLLDGAVRMVGHLLWVAGGGIAVAVTGLLMWRGR